MTKARRRRVLLGAAALGIAAGVAVQLYPSDREHQAEASVQLLTADRSPQTTLHFTSADISRPATLSRLAERAATQSPVAVEITANAKTEGRARALVGDATQQAQAALASGSVATPEVVAQAEQDVTDAKARQADAETAVNAADSAIADWHADKGAEDPSARIAQIERQLAALRDQRSAGATQNPSLEAQIAQVQQDLLDAQSAQQQFADLEARRASAAKDLERATAAVGTAEARLARYQTGATGSIAVAPIATETVVADRGFGAGVTIATLVALAAMLAVLALATRPRAAVVVDLTQPDAAPVDPAPPDPAPEPEAVLEAQPEPVVEPARAPVVAAHDGADDLPPRPNRPFTTVKLRPPDK
jgi:hypothetical protein